MQNTKFLLILMIGVVLLVAPASAGLTSEAGETWIKWEWPDVGNATAQYNLYLDGELISENATLKYYYLTDISSHEEHTFEIRSPTTGEQIASNTAKTLTSLYLIMVLVIFSFVLALLTMFIKEHLRVIICGVLGEVICFYLLGLSYGYGFLWMVVIAFMVFMAYFVIKSLYEYGTDVINWW